MNRSQVTAALRENPNIISVVTYVTYVTLVYKGGGNMEFPPKSRGRGCNAYTALRPKQRCQNEADRVEDGG